MFNTVKLKTDITKTILNVEPCDHGFESKNQNLKLKNKKIHKPFETRTLLDLFNKAKINVTIIAIIK